MTESILKLKELNDCKFPENLLKVTPYGYQKVGSLFMYYVKKCFNLDDTGLGKTCEVLGTLKLIQTKEEKWDIKVLVVATSGLLYQWESETKKFTNLLPVVSDGGETEKSNNL